MHGDESEVSEGKGKVGKEIEVEESLDNEDMEAGQGANENVVNGKQWTGSSSEGRGAIDKGRGAEAQKGRGADKGGKEVNKEGR